MKTALMALGIGVVVEAALVTSLAVGGFGPCGPASPLSAFVFFVHTPGLSAASAMGLREPESLLLVMAAYVVAWSGIAFLILGGRSRRSL
jgi:hypothetical protein